MSSEIDDEKNMYLLINELEILSEYIKSKNPVKDKQFKISPMTTIFLKSADKLYLLFKENILCYLI